MNKVVANTNNKLNSRLHKRHFVKIKSHKKLKSALINHNQRRKNKKRSHLWMQISEEILNT